MAISAITLKLETHGPFISQLPSEAYLAQRQLQVALVNCQGVSELIATSNFSLCSLLPILWQTWVRMLSIHFGVPR